MPRVRQVGILIMIITGKLKIPGILKTPLIEREIEINGKGYDGAKDKQKYIQLCFLHAIQDEIEVECHVKEK